MEGPERETSSVVHSSTVVLLLAALAFVAVGRQVPYSGSRPETIEQTKTQYPAIQDVPARLWQDPFGAITRHRNDNDSVPLLAVPEGERHTLEFFGRSVNDTANTLLVMPVLIPGGRHSEDGEGRRRTRYAVVSGLHNAGFTPVDADHIGYVRTARPDTYPELVAYEWFESVTPSSPNAPSSAVVVWIDEDTLAAPGLRGDVLVRLNALLGMLSLCPTTPAPPTQRLAIIGPQYSTTLARMQVAATTGGERDLACLARAAFYSPWATIRLDDEPALFTGLNNGAQFFRMIPTDHAALAEVVKELRRRGVDVTRPTDHVALIAEWDSVYTRAIETTLRDEACQGTPGCADRVHVYSYLRGLDGAVPDVERRRSQESGPAEPSRTDAPKRPPSAEDLERSDGRHQFDYLRRLAGRMQRIENDLYRQTGAGFKAIGVVGNDVYDKLLVLQAVRGFFPRATFFSTDLDSRFLHPHEFPWTRNLVVASGYGLRLREELQQELPPFRDAYQTATFLAVMVAARHASERFEAPKRDVIAGWMTKPRAFEIGRTAAVDLSATEASAPCNLSNCADVNPPAPFFRWPLWETVGSALLALAVLAVVVITACPALRALVRLVARGTPPRWFWPGVASVVLASVAVASAIWLEGADGEPFSWLEGVSMWPTEILRAATATCAIVFIVVARSCLQRVRRELRSKFFSTAPMVADAPSWRALWSPGTRTRTLAAIFAPILGVEPPRTVQRVAGIVPADPGGLDADALWAEHECQASGTGPIVRVIAAAGLFTALAFALMSHLGFPALPRRGLVVVVVDRVLLIACIMTAVGLLFYVLDAVNLCHNFARQLANEKVTAWEPIVRRREAQKLGVDENWVPLSYWLDVEVVGAWTRHIKGLVYLPFFIGGLLLVARASFFDNWDLPVGLLVTFILVGLLAVWACLLLRTTAERVRSQSLSTLTRALIREKANRSGTADQLEVVIDIVRSRRDGAFAPVMQQPIIRALLLPLTGAGGVALLEWFLLGR